MLETFVAFLLVCGLNGSCTWVHDPSAGYSKSVVACQVKLDELQKKIEQPKNELAIFNKVGNWHVNAHHRGVCFDGKVKKTICP